MSLASTLRDLSSTTTSDATESAASIGSVAAFHQSESSRQQQFTAALQRLEADGAPARLVHLPSAEPTTVADGAVVPGPEEAAELATRNVSGPYESAAPAPAGIAYYGESGNALNPTPTVVDTTSLAGTLNVSNLTTLYLDSDDPDAWGAQLNAVLTNVTLWGSDGPGPDGYAFWAQNVVSYQQFNDTLQFVENTWNFTNLQASIPFEGAGTIVANDTNDSADLGVVLGASPYLYAPAPFNLTLYLNLSLYNPLLCGPWSSLRALPICENPSQALNAYAGDQTLFYNYSLSFPSDNTKVPAGTHEAGSFDWLTFHTSAAGAADAGSNHRSAGFEASGYAPGAVEDDDFELDLGLGAYDGANQVVFGANGTASLDYLSDCTKWPGLAATCSLPSEPVYRPVPSAYDFGSETGETTNGLEIAFEPTQDVARFSAGPLGLHPLWGFTGASGSSPGATPVTNQIEVSGSPVPVSRQPYIFVFLSETSAGGPFAGYAWAPDVPVWYLPPGTYAFEALLAGYAEQNGTFTVGGAPVTVSASLPYDPSAGVYTPIWAVEPSGSLANGELAGVSSSGNGSLRAPYRLFNTPDSNPGGELAPEFLSLNDYSYPTYPGLLLWNTTAYVETDHEVPFFDGTLLDGLRQAPTYLQQELYETQHVTLANSTLLGWSAFSSLSALPASQNLRPQGELMIWNSTNDLVRNDTFLATRPIAAGWVSPDELVLYGGGGECSTPTRVGPGPAVEDPCGGQTGPAPLGSQNVVWGSTFCDAPEPATPTECRSASPRSPGTYAGLAEAEGGDLIYNNAFRVDNPAPLMPWDLETGDGPVYYYDTWNVSEQAADNVARTVNGFALSGNVLDEAGKPSYPLQGGNYWWNYGNSLNPRSIPVFRNVVDYTLGYRFEFPAVYNSSVQPGLLGAGDASPLPGLAVTFQAAGLPRSVTWWIALALPGQSEPLNLSDATTDRLAVDLPDGTYTFSAGSVDRRYTAPAGSVTVEGRALTLKVRFSLARVDSTSAGAAGDPGRSGSTGTPEAPNSVAGAPVRRPR